MNKKETQEITSRFIKFLKNTPDTFLHKQLEGPVPESDDQYISMWSDYLKFISKKNEFNEKVLDHLSYERVSKNEHEIEFSIFDRIRDLIEKDLMEKRNQINFQPRIEKYLEEFPAEERDNIRNLLIYLIRDEETKAFRDNIVTIARNIGIDMKWVLSLSDDHPLNRHDILEFKGLSFEESKPLQEKEISLDFVVKKLFLGTDISDTELYQLKSTPLLELFDLADDELIAEIMLQESDREDDVIHDNFGDDFGTDEEGLDIENMIASLESDRIEALDNSIEEIASLHDDENDVKSGDEEDEKNDSESQPYTSDLDYLEQEFLWLKAKAELVEKKNDTFAFDPNGDEKKMKELEQKVTRQKNLCKVRLRKSIKSGFTPRIVALQNKFRFSDFEINTIKAIITNKLFPTSHGFGTSPNNVGSVLMLLIDDMKDRVKALKAFRKKSKLVKSNIIQIEKNHLGQDLFNCSIEMDNRITEYLRGENFDISDYFDGGYMSKSGIHMDSVIMDENEKEEFLVKVRNYPRLVETRKKLKMTSSFEYGRAQVNLFVGPSGTGKTMLAYALSNYLDKKILVFNLNNYSNISYFHEPDKSLFSLLFREARMNDAILFFDESENLLQNRINDLLLELESHQGIVIFATNASFVIDEALKRRINHVQHFKEPGPNLRKKIWKVHMPKNVKLSEDIDLDKLAMRYEINGGLIKNAVFSSIAHAVGDSATTEISEVELNMKHLENGADEQLKNKLFMSKLEKQISPSKSFQDIILPEKTLKELKKIAESDKSRKVLVGEWGFGEVFKNMNGRVLLLHGPPGTGKTLSAEALAYETGKHLKVVNYSQVLSKWVGETEKALEALMDEVMETDSILLFDEADGLFASRTDVSSVNDRYANMITNVLLSLTENFNSIAVLTTNYIDNIDPAFYRRMELIEFEMPDKELRFRLWEKLLPEKMPLADDVNLNMLAKKFEFSGGDIKNAIIDAASSRAVILDGPRTVSMDDFLEACEKIRSQKSNGLGKIGFGH